MGEIVVTPKLFVAFPHILCIFSLETTHLMTVLRSNVPEFAFHHRPSHVHLFGQTWPFAISFNRLFVGIYISALCRCGLHQWYLLI